MVIKNFDITLDLKKNKRINTIEVVQGDFETNIFNIEVTDDYEPLDITGTTVEILFAKPDNTTVMQDMESGVVVADAANGKMTITLNTNTIAAPGVVHSELRIKEAGKIATTARFSFIVRKAIVSNVVSSNEFPVLEKLIKDAEDYLEVFPEWAGQEVQRQSNEQGRVTAEQNRVLAEQQRENTFATYEPRIDDVESELDKKVDKITGKGLSTEDYTTDEKNKLSSIQSGAEVNQFAFSHVNVDGAVLSADQKTDTLFLSAGNGVNFVPNPSNDSIVTHITNATTSARGIVQLSTSTSSTSATMAATPSAVKEVNDKIGDLSVLTTENKTNLVRAINEVDDELSAAVGYISSELDKKLNITTFATEISKKADKTYVDTELSKKTSQTEFDSHKLDIANQIQDIRGALALAHYDPDKGEYVNLDQYWNSLRNGKVYTVEFNQFSVSPSPTGTKKDDNEGLICEPSTNTMRGRNDYENIGLFMAIDVNGYVDENDDYHVTAIEGDSKFKRDGTNGDVWVMAMPGYIKRYSDENVWGICYSDAMHPGFEIIDEAVKPDGTIRPYLLHAKYIAGRNPIDGKLASISGVYPEHVNMSHNGQIIEFKAKGVQYSGKTSHDDFYVQLMFWLKYATTHSQSIMQGCSSYYLQYTNLVAETGVKRVIVTNSQANSLLIGSCVSIGDYDGSTKTDDRQQARNYNVANRVNIVDIVDLGDGNSAVYIDFDDTFNTTLTTTITTYPWYSGSCDNVLGTDGSPYNNQSSKEPFIINKIETMVGGYEVLQNLIISNNSADNRVDVYANYDCKTYATSITAAYDLVGQLAQTNNTWQYGSKMVVPNNHPSVILITEAEGSSTTGTGDGIYTNPPSAGGARVWRSLGPLHNGALCGLRCLIADDALSTAYWAFLGRLSATGRSRRRAGVN